MVVGSSPTSGEHRSPGDISKQTKEILFCCFALQYFWRENIKVSISHENCCFASLAKGGGPSLGAYPVSTLPELASRRVGRPNLSSKLEPFTWLFPNTVGLVVEYTPATGETRVRFSDGVARATKSTASPLCSVIFLPKFGIYHDTNSCRSLYHRPVKLIIFLKSNRNTPKVLGIGALYPGFVDDPRQVKSEHPKSQQIRTFRSRIVKWYKTTYCGGKALQFPTLLACF